MRKLLKKHRHKIKAFSLIELAIVMLIIGVFILSVTQSSSIFRKIKVRSAQSITQSSPVSGIRNLVMWLEPTLDESFIDSETEDGTQISRWKDSSPQNTIKYYGFKAASSEITYKKDGINGLPSLNFSGYPGANAYLTLKFNSSSVAIPTISNIFTFFIVSKLDSSVTSSDNADRALFYNGVSDTNGWGYFRSGGAGIGIRSILFGGVSSLDTTAATSTTQPEVISGTYIGGSSGLVKLYVNGAAATLATTTATALSPTTALYIGNTKAASDGVQPWKGYISEIIIFDSTLTNTDRIDIERYLGKKYGITVQ